MQNFGRSVPAVCHETEVILILNNSLIIPPYNLELCDNVLIKVIVQTW